MTIGYFAYNYCQNRYIITIEVPDPPTLFCERTINPEFATYTTYTFKIINIEKFGSSVNVECTHEQGLKVGCTEEFTDIFMYNISYDKTYMQNFMALELYKFFKHGCAGVCKSYTNSGELLEDFFHNNGSIEGKKNIYKRGKEIMSEYYINGNKID